MLYNTLSDWDKALITASVTSTNGWVLYADTTYSWNWSYNNALEISLKDQLSILIDNMASDSTKSYQKQILAQEAFNTLVSLLNL